MVVQEHVTEVRRRSGVSTVSPPSMTEDEQRLRQLGYKQELSRELSLLKNFAVSFGLLSMLTGLGGFYGYGFQHGGPVAVVWGWPLAVTMTLTVALPMAEVCSALPTSGGVYFWAGTLGGRHGPLFSWVTGWFNLLGQVGITAGVEYTVVMFLQQLVSIGRGEYYAFSQAEQYGLYCGFVILHGVANAISVKLLGLLSVVSVYWHIIGTVGVVAALLAIAPTHQSADFVFATFVPNPSTGVDNPFYLFLLGLLMSQWAMTGYDTSAHIAEETKNAAVAGPVGLIMAIVSSFLCGWMFLLSLTFSIQDVDNITNPDTISGGYATSQIFIDAFNARWGKTTPALSLMLVLFIASNFCGTFCVTANSRMLYAFSRDDGIPGSRWWKKVNPHTNTPVNSIIAMVCAAIVLGTSLLGSTVAFSAMSSIGVIGMYISYGIPQVLRLTVARSWFKKGPFHLGRFSYLIGWIGVFWCCFITVVFALPNYYPIDSQTLNYAPVAVGVTLIFSLGWWMLGARKWFKGPVRNVDVKVKTACLAEAYQRGELDTDSDGDNDKASGSKDDDGLTAGTPQEEFLDGAKVVFADAV